MKKEEFMNRSAGYALGALDEKERIRFEEYLRTASEKERAFVRELVGTASLLPLALETEAPRAELKDLILQRVTLSMRASEGARQRTRSLSRRMPSGTPNWIPYGIAASLALIVVFSVFMFRLLGTIEEQNQLLVTAAQENAQMQVRLTALEEELARKDAYLNVLSAREIHVSIMNGLQVNPVGYGKIIWDPAKRTAVLHVSNLPAVPTDKDYQLWVIRGKTPISAGVFAVGSDESNFFKIEHLAVTNPKEISAFAVTLEPKGGMPQPTGDMYMMGAPQL